MKKKVRGVRPTPEEKKRRKAQKRAQFMAAQDALRKQYTEFLEARARAMGALPAELDQAIDWSLRPRELTPELAELVCNRISHHALPLRKLCQAEGMPHMETILQWVRESESFYLQYARAKVAQTELMAEECLDIADTPQMGEVTVASMRDGVKITRADMIDHRRLRVDTRKWLAGKLNPKRFGNQLALTGPGGGPIKTQRVADEMGDAELESVVRGEA